MIRLTTETVNINLPQRRLEIAVGQLDEPVEGIPAIVALATENGIHTISLRHRPIDLELWIAALEEERQNPEVRIVIGSSRLEELYGQLQEYFVGKRKEFHLDLDYQEQGTSFQRQVWDHLRTIPYGETCSYGDLAGLLRKPGAARAVGQANGRNPIPVVIPCHRVIAADGGLGGFTGGLDLKKVLLGLEGRDDWKGNRGVI